MYCGQKIEKAHCNYINFSNNKIENEVMLLTCWCQTFPPSYICNPFNLFLLFLWPSCKLLHVVLLPLPVLLFLSICLQDEVHKLTTKFDLLNKQRKDSQGICFLGKVCFLELPIFLLIFQKISSSLEWRNYLYGCQHANIYTVELCIDWFFMVYLSGLFEMPNIIPSVFYFFCLVMDIA